MDYIEKLKEKQKLRQKIKQYRKDNPDKTLQQIGNYFGLTRARICQILKDKNGSNAGA